MSGGASRTRTLRVGGSLHPSRIDSRTSSRGTGDLGPGPDSPSSRPSGSPPPRPPLSRTSLLAVGLLLGSLGCDAPLTAPGPPPAETPERGLMLVLGREPFRAGFRQRVRELLRARGSRPFRTTGTFSILRRELSLPPGEPLKWQPLPSVERPARRPGIAQRTRTPPSKRTYFEPRSGRLLAPVSGEPPLSVKKTTSVFSSDPSRRSASRKRPTPSSRQWRLAR